MPYLWDVSVSLGENVSWNQKDDEIKISLVFLGLTTVIGLITGLPFELYSTFYIEKKHGFNKQTLSLFFTDKVKSTVLTMLIGGPFVTALLKIIKWGGEYFYLYVWAFMFVFSIVMMTLVPVFIMPLFNKYETLPDGELKTRIYALAERLNYPLTKLFQMDGSKRSSHSNAFMFGFGSNKRIVLFDTLMEQVDDDEILAILGHELGHWKLGHTLANLVVTQTYMGAAFYSFSLCFNSTGLYRAFGFDGSGVPTIIALLLFFQTIWAPADKILSLALTEAVYQPSLPSSSSSRPSGHRSTKSCLSPRHSLAGTTNSLPMNSPHRWGMRPNSARDCARLVWRIWGRCVRILGMRCTITAIRRLWSG